jgi:nucleobase transporter 1/2
MDLFFRFFSPLGMAPVVGLVGLGLFERGFPVVGVIQISILTITIFIEIYILAKW